MEIMRVALQIVFFLGVDLVDLNFTGENNFLR